MEQDVSLIEVFLFSIPFPLEKLETLALAIDKAALLQEQTVMLRIFHFLIEPHKDEYYARKHAGLGRNAYAIYPH